MDLAKPTMNTSVNDRGRWNTAYHEAGHCIACFDLGFRIKGVTITPSKFTNDRTTHQSPLDDIGPSENVSDRARMKAEKAIQIYFAGPIAQREYAPRSRWRVYGGRDFDHAAGLLLSIAEPGKIGEAYHRLLWLQTEALVRRRWGIIVRLAKAMYDTGVMDGKLIRKTMINLTTDKVFSNETLMGKD